MFQNLETKVRALHQTWRCSCLRSRRYSYDEYWTTGVLDTLDIAFRDDLDNDTYVAPKSRVSFSIKHGDQPQSKRGLRIC